MLNEVPGLGRPPDLCLKAEADVGFKPLWSRSSLHTFRGNPGTVEVPFHVASLLTTLRLTGLEKLELAGRFVVGSPEILSSFTALRSLRITQCPGFAGALADIAESAPNLEELYIEEDEDNFPENEDEEEEDGYFGIVGILESLAPLTLLRRLGLSGCALIEGDVAVLGEFDLLESACLGGIGGCGIEGDISCLSGCCRLQELDVYCCTLTGDIAVFASCEFLRKVDFDGCDIHGNISVFATCLHMAELIFSECSSITGSVEALCRLLKLEVVNFGGCTKVVGSLESFASLESLQEVFLNGTSISGDINCFNRCLSLRVLSVIFCSEISGSVDSLVALTHLEKVFLSGSSCFGDASLLEQAAPGITIYGHRAHPPSF